MLYPLSYEGGERRLATPARQLAAWVTACSAPG